MRNEHQKITLSLVEEVLPCQSGDTMYTVKSRSVSRKRRRLSLVVRKAITSYYTEPEQQEITQAALKQQVSMSSFVATAALAEARRVNRKRSS